MIAFKNKCGLNGPLPETTTDDELYDYFIKNIYYGDLKINGMKIKVFTTPFEDNRMQGFFHLMDLCQLFRHIFSNNIYLTVFKFIPISF